MILIYQFGTFDVANFGDLLFPILAQKRLASLNAKVVAVSPIGAPPVWEECVPSVGIDEIMNISDKPSGVLIGGGNILTLQPTKLPAYNRGAVSLLAYPDIWIGASCLAADEVPVCWNAPGVPAAFSSEQYPFVRDCINRSSYVSVRDEQSRKFLLEAYPSAEISVFPDPAWEISNLWTSDLLEETYDKVFNNCGEKRPPRSITIHLNSRYMSSLSNQAVARYLDELARKFEARIVLLAIGPCHQDDVLARVVGTFMKTRPLIMDRPTSLKEIVSCIAHSEAYIGSSMHGLITASSFCVPGICVILGEKPKFQGLQEQFGQKDIWSHSWETIPKQLLSLKMAQKKIQLRELRERILEKVDQHWNHIISCIGNYLKDNDKITQKDNKICQRSINCFLSYRANFTTSKALCFYSKANEIIKKDAENTEEEFIVKKDIEEIQKDLQIAEKNEELYRVYISRSWRYTALFRKMNNVVRKCFSQYYWLFFRKLIKAFYWLLPGQLRNSNLIETLKNKIKNIEI